MADRKILVPGTGGTKLLKNGESLGHPKLLNAKLWLFKKVGADVEQTVLDMSMKHKPGQPSPERTTLAPNAEVTPGELLTAAYNLIEQRVDDTFVYDWRGDIEHSAALLLERLREERPANGRFRIVNHSQGGLVTLAASKLCEEQDGPGGFSRLVSRIAFVGVPIHGTLNAAHALLEGTDLGEDSTTEFRRIAATWPALYQMLPNFSALRSQAGQVIGHTFMHTATYAPHTWIDKDLLRRAFDFKKRFLAHPASALQGIAYTFLFGSNKPTWRFATRADDGQITFGEKTPRAGDGLLPLEDTLKSADSAVRDHHEVVGPNENTAEHAMMLTDDFYVTRVMQVLG